MATHEPLMINNKRQWTEECNDKGSKRLRWTAATKDVNIEATKDDLNRTEDSSAPTAPVHPGVGQPFRLMDLPTEVRLEIYRACLTRPFNILLSKKPPPPPPPPPLSPHDASELAIFTSQADPTVPLRRSARHRRPGQAPLQIVPPQLLPQQGRQPGRPTGGIAHASTQSDYAAWVQRLPPMPPPVRPAQLIQLPSISTEEETPKPRPEHLDPLLVNLLRVSKQIYKEARPVLYGDNQFLLDLDTALNSLAALHQRSRGQIRHLRLTIRTHSEILERFAEVVRLSLRYCWRLQTFTIDMPFLQSNNDAQNGSTAVYANAFDILRWLPRKCQVVLEGHITDDIRRVVQRNANLAKNLDEVLLPKLNPMFISSYDIQLAYARRQLISNDAELRVHQDLVLM